MDPLSISASVISIVSLSRATLRNLVASESKALPSDLRRQAIKFDAYIALLESVSQHSLGGTSPYVGINALGTCVKLCHESLKEVEQYLYKPTTQRALDTILSSKDKDKLGRALGDFMEAVKLVKELADESHREWVVDTLSAIRTQHTEQLQEIGFKVEYLMKLTADSSEYSREQLQKAVEELSGKLRANAAESMKWQPDASDPFSFSATIICAHDDEGEHTVARGKLDSGCDEDWISLEILKRAGIESEIVVIEDPKTYTPFGGQGFQPIGTVHVTWFAQNASISRKTEFLVHDAVPFDMVLGKVFIREESIFVFDKPALALRQGRFTKEELREIEVNARKKNATNEQLASIRRADEASSRERLRQQKAASRIATPTAMSLSPRSGLAQSLLTGSRLSRPPSIQSTQSLFQQPTRMSSQSQPGEPLLSPLSTLDNSEKEVEADPQRPW